MRDLLRIQLAPIFSGVLCGTYERITKEKVIFLFSMWGRPKKLKFWLKHIFGFNKLCFIVRI